MWGRSFLLGRLFGIPVRLHWLWLAVVALVLLRGAGLQDLGRFMPAVGLIALASTFLLAHELSHALAARRLGLPPGPIVLGPFFNALYLLREPARPREELLVAAAGPAANGVLATLLLGGVAVAGEHVAPEVLRWLRLAGWINLAMALGNLLPAFPLDGGRVLRAALATRMPWLVASRLAVRIGNLAALAVPLMALLSATVRTSPLLLGVLALLAVVLIRAGRRQENAALIRELELQVGRGEVEVSEDVRAVLGSPSPPVPGGYRPLTPAQFRTWRTPCEEACRRTLGRS